MKFKIVNASNNSTILTENCFVANTFFSRLKGLQFQKEFNEKDGLFLKKCSMVHTFFMFMRIDVIFLDKDYNIIHLKQGMKPWKISRYYPTARYILELPHKTIKKTKTKMNDKLKVIKLS